MALPGSDLANFPGQPGLRTAAGAADWAWRTCFKFKLDSTRPGLAPPAAGLWQAGGHKIIRAGVRRTDSHTATVTGSLPAR